MDVVLDTAYAVEHAIVVLDDAPDVAVHLFAAALGDSHLTAIGVDDDVVNSVYCAHNK